MAKIKIKGFPELIAVPNDKAISLKSKLQDENLQNVTVSLGDWTGKINQIAFVLTDQEVRITVDTYKEKLAEYYKKRDALIALSPRERAEKTTWSYFKLFYKGIYEKEPDLSLRADLIERVVIFFQEKPRWSKPSVLVFMDYLNVEKSSIRMNENYLRIIERIEANEIEDARQDIDYLEKVKETREIEDQAIEALYDKDEIKVEDLPF